MFPRTRHAAVAAALAAFLVLPVLATADPPASTSAAPTKELITLLAKRLESGMAFLAAKDPEKAGHYVGALYLESVPQLLVVVADYDPAVLMDDRIAKRDYREAYTDLNSASKAGTRVFFEDLRADGLSPTRDGSDPFDMFSTGDGKRVQFDGDWKRAKQSEKEYFDEFVAADKVYAKAIQALIAEAKKGS